MQQIVIFEKNHNISKKDIRRVHILYENNRLTEYKLPIITYKIFFNIFLS